MAKGFQSRVGSRPLYSVLLALIVGTGFVTWAGCASKEPARKAEKTSPATAPAQPADAKAAAMKAARIAQLRNIVANRSTLAAYAAVIQLAKTKAPGAFEAIAASLTNENLLVRMCCAKELGTLEDPRALPLLRNAMQSKYTGLKLAAVVGLGELGAAARPAVAELGSLLGQQFPPMHPSVKHLAPDDRGNRRTISMRIHLAVLKALGDIGGPDAQAILATELDPQRGTDIEWTAAKALKAMGARETLLACGQKDSGAAWRMLAEMKCAAALPGMLEQVRNPKVPVSRQAQIIYAIGVLKDRRATAVLLQLLRSKSNTICRAAAWSLNQLAYPESLAGLVDHVKRAPPNSYWLFSATCAIGAIQTPAALDALRQLAAHPSSNVRGAVAHRLNERATARDLPLLIGLLRDPQAVDYPPVKALTRLLPESAGPLIDLLPSTGPKLQITIARILATHEPARPNLRTLLKSQDKMVRNSVRTILWKQRDPSVPLVDWIGNNPGWGSPVDERDLPELKRLAGQGNERQSNFAIATLVRLEPKTAWVHVRPMFYKDDKAALRAYNLIGEKYSDWIEQELVEILEHSDGLSRYACKELLCLLHRGNRISPEAVAVYRMFADSGDQFLRLRAYECLYREASDESMALLARKALAGDEPAKWAVGGNPDKRLAETFGKLVEQAIANRETWLGGYVHCWPTAPGVTEYVAAVGSNYATQLTKARQIAAETVPD